MSALPPPPDPGVLDPLAHEWPAGLALVRCHSSAYGATEFNPGRGSGRFHPFAGAAGATVPTLYGSDSFDGALSETVFHDVPVAGPARRVLAAVLVPVVVSTLAPRRTLRLARLFGYGLGRLGLTRAGLVETPDHSRPWPWAAALHAPGGRFDGLAWVSRQYDRALAVVLFGDRVGRDELEVVEPPLPLAAGPGFERVQEAAEAAGITVVV